MPRKSTKNSTENTMSAIDEAINTPVNFQFCEVAEELGIGEAELRERLEDKIGHPGVHQMDTIPSEWESAIKAIKIDLEAESSVRRLSEATEQPIEQQASLSEAEPPIIEEEQKPQVKKKRTKRNSTALTQTKTEEIAQTVNDKEKQAMGEEETLQILYGERGRASGANLATAELYIRQLAYSQTKGDALNREIAVLVEDIVKLGQFSPEEIAQKLGLNSSQTQYKSIHEVVAAALPKLRNASEEIHDTAWKNGKDAQSSLLMLDSLMS